MTKYDDSPLFAFEDLQEEFVEAQNDNLGWKILIVDDEPSIHTVTQLALSGFTFAEQPLTFLNAYSAEEAKIVLSEHSDISVILLDVVMETDNAGLELVDYIRNELSNNEVRIILRTGQPGQAPEYKVIKQYDINDYKAKTELTNQKLNTTIYSSLRSYRDITAINRTRMGLEQIIESTATLLQENSLKKFAEGALKQLAAMMHLDAEVVLAKSTSAFAAKTEDSIELLACIERGHAKKENVDITQRLIDHMDSNNYERNHMITLDNEALFISSAGNQELILYLQGTHDILSFDSNILEVFCRNITIALENLRLNDELQRTQKEIVYSICEVAETRSKETGNHVRRVALYSQLLAQKYGLKEKDSEMLLLAAPLHDVGKIGIPDSILNFNGKLIGDDWETMKTHVDIGKRVLENSSLPIMRAAAIVAAQHHENWDGSGYPAGLKGKDIHIFGRIVALADVFDALMCQRCYKPAWVLKNVEELLINERGKKFEPALVDIFFNNKDEFLAIHQKFSDR